MVFDYILVLVNGKCCYCFVVIIFLGGGLLDGVQGFDIFIILVVVLKQVEVLCDGVVVQYGFDVIVGVVNFVLKDDVEGGMFEVCIGFYYEGDGDMFQFIGNVGMFLGDDGFVNFIVEYCIFDVIFCSVQCDDVVVLIFVGNIFVVNLL